ncbi:heme O synthase-like polyprenyltransferase, partial [Weissella beninensis]
SFVSVTFVLILVEVVRQIVNKKYQKIVQVLACLLFFWLLTIGVDNVSNLLHISSTNSMNLARLVFDIVLVALEILFSILLIDKKISTLH